MKTKNKLLVVAIVLLELAGLILFENNHTVAAFIVAATSIVPGCIVANLKRNSYE